MARPPVTAEETGFWLALDISSLELSNFRPSQ